MHNGKPTTQTGDMECAGAKPLTTGRSEPGGLVGEGWARGMGVGDGSGGWEGGMGVGDGSGGWEWGMGDRGWEWGMGGGSSGILHI